MGADESARAAAGKARGELVPKSGPEVLTPNVTPIKSAAGSPPAAAAAGGEDAWARASALLLTHGFAPLPPGGDAGGRASAVLLARLGEVVDQYARRGQLVQAPRLPRSRPRSRAPLLTKQVLFDAGENASSVPARSG